ncbi:MAG: hypothetical protein IKW33_03475 [Clostridia bacterium]|nr:hypothetical protein [Clostridia bacterium]
MNLKKTKFIMICCVFITLLFFSNDFGIINIEKTAIVTALAIDIEKEDYVVSAQIAVPEATDTNSENQKALITGKDKTIAGAIRNIGNLSGWYPKLAFCNLMIFGKEVANENIMKVLDYFATTLRIQDSAVVVLAEDKAREILETASPLDNISSFALQKILLKETGFDRDVSTTDVRAFCAGYYSKNSSSVMPIIKLLTETSKGQEKGNSSSSSNSSNTGQNGGSSGGNGATSSNKGDTLYDATTTALFLGGKKVGELNTTQTNAFNFIMTDSKESTIKINGVGRDKINYLLNIKRSNPKRVLTIENGRLNLEFSLDLFCKIVDKTSMESNQNVEVLPLPLLVKEMAEESIKNSIIDLIEIEKSTGCDFLKIKDTLYQNFYDFYPTFKDNYLELLDYTVKVNVSGQK